MPIEELATTPSLLKVDGRYVCADNLRFACILAIIAVHSTSILAPGAAPGAAMGAAIEMFQFAAITALKFGTIGFFLISGFLLEKNLHAQSSVHLMRRRIRKVLLPWTFWFVLTCVALSVSDFIHHKRAFQSGTPLDISLLRTATHTFTTTAFWFVPNLMMSLMVLLVFRRYLQSLLFGAALLGTSLFYSLNIYTQWTDTPHTRALFGFIFYLWLGHYAAINMERFTGLLRSIPTGVLWGATLISGFAEFGEGRLLVHLHSVDPLNTLKVTTQVFSMLVFLCFFKYQRPIWPTFFDVQRTTFGMYLSHVLTLAAVTTPMWALTSTPGPHPILGSFAIRVSMWLATVALTSGTSLMLARILSASPPCAGLWGITGAPKERKLKTEATQVAIVPERRRSRLRVRPKPHQGTRLRVKFAKISHAANGSMKLDCDGSIF